MRRRKSHRRVDRTGQSEQVPRTRSSIVAPASATDPGRGGRVGCEWARTVEWDSSIGILASRASQDPSAVHRTPGPRRLPRPSGRVRRPTQRAVATTVHVPSREVPRPVAVNHRRRQPRPYRQRGGRACTVQRRSIHVCMRRDSTDQPLVRTHPLPFGRTATELSIACQATTDQRPTQIARTAGPAWTRRWDGRSAKRLTAPEEVLYRSERVRVRCEFVRCSYMPPRRQPTGSAAAARYDLTHLIGAEYDMPIAIRKNNPNGSSTWSASVRRAIEATTMATNITGAQLAAVRRVIECEVNKVQARRARQPHGSASTPPSWRRK